jgi:hypothetical protein
MLPSIIVFTFLRNAVNGAHHRYVSSYMHMSYGAHHRYVSSYMHMSSYMVRVSEISELTPTIPGSFTSQGWNPQPPPPLDVHAKEEDARAWRPGGGASEHHNSNNHHEMHNHNQGNNYFGVSLASPSPSVWFLCSLLLCA